MFAHKRLSQRNPMCSTAARQSLDLSLREQLTVLYLFQLVEPKFMREQICIICIYYIYKFKLNTLKKFHSRSIPWQSQFSSHNNNNNSNRDNNK